MSGVCPREGGIGNDGTIGTYDGIGGAMWCGARGTTIGVWVGGAQPVNGAPCGCCHG